MLRLHLLDGLWARLGDGLGFGIQAGGQRRQVSGGRQQLYRRCVRLFGPLGHLDTVLKTEDLAVHDAKSSAASLILTITTKRPV
jgi:hypothetical protein